MKTIKQTVTFNASPHEIFEMLMDSKKHSQFTESDAKISRKVGGKFTTYDGYASGVNKVLVKDKKIVQTWRGSDWPEGLFSTITIELANISSKTKLTFVQENVPEDQYESIKKGWIEFYWDRIKEVLKG
jgi:activator of HSP90 ATPase